MHIPILLICLYRDQSDINVAIGAGSDVPGSLTLPSDQQHSLSP